MDLAFKKILEAAPSDVAWIATLDPTQRRQLIIVAKAFQGHDLDFDDGGLARHATALDQLFEFGFKFLHVVDRQAPTTPRFDVWSDNIDFVHVFVHGTITDAGAGRTQGPFDPTDPTNPAHVELAAALQAAYLRAPRADSP